MATPETRNELIGTAGAPPEAVDGQQFPADRMGYVDEFATLNRISPWFILGAGVGFAVALVGFIAGAFWVIAAGSGLTLVSAWLWIAAGMPPLVRTIRGWLKIRRRANQRRGARK